MKTILVISKKKEWSVDMTPYKHGSETWYIGLFRIHQPNHEKLELILSRTKILFGKASKEIVAVI